MDYGTAGENAHVSSIELQSKKAENEKRHDEQINSVWVVLVPLFSRASGLMNSVIPLHQGFLLVFRPCYFLTLVIAPAELTLG
jgi:hypothetical protein